MGTSDVVYAGLNDTLTDGGSSTLFNIKGKVGALSIAGFGAHPTGGHRSARRRGGLYDRPEGVRRSDERRFGRQPAVARRRRFDRPPRRPKGVVARDELQIG